MIKDDPFINVMVEQTGVHTVVHQSFYDRYPKTFRHLGPYEEEDGELTRKEMMDILSTKGITFSSSATKAELKALLEGE